MLQLMIWQNCVIHPGLPNIRFCVSGIRPGQAFVLVNGIDLRTVPVRSGLGNFEYTPP